MWFVQTAVSTKPRRSSSFSTRRRHQRPARVHLDRAAEKGSELIGGRGTLGGRLLEAEDGPVLAAERGLDRLPRLLEQMGSEFRGQVRVLPCRPGQVSRVGEDVGHRQTHQRARRHVAEAGVHRTIERTVFGEGGGVGFRGVVEERDEVAGRRAITGLSPLDPLHPAPRPVLAADEMVDEVADLPLPAGGLEVELVGRDVGVAAARDVLALARAFVGM